MNLRLLPRCPRERQQRTASFRRPDRPRQLARTSRRFLLTSPRGVRTAETITSGCGVPGSQPKLSGPATLTHFCRISSGFPHPASAEGSRFREKGVHSETHIDHPNSVGLRRSQLYIWAGSPKLDLQSAGLPEPDLRRQHWQFVHLYQRMVHKRQRAIRLIRRHRIQLLVPGHAASLGIPGHHVWDGCCKFQCQCSVLFFWDRVLVHVGRPMV
jgi:hypothetical protein